ncbi:DUF177 domain-containing protein [Collinsella sp. zg1085]|uniref:YceD family protein n=1 Tax=Collinsella sp. zg1085 TaxID=2844380 RepID=UPI001C0CD0C0|nr:DUF177 domain-containing protein [Collinsella sp. zg1085]QWT17124.1 DUF177 domain-containing protein [Collinsella sp. zg1085]
MAMPSVIIDLTAQLENPGEAQSFTGDVSLDSYTIGERTLVLAQGLSYDLVLTNAGNGILLSGLVRAQAQTSCDRCLDEAFLDIAAEIEEFYLFEEQDVRDDDEDGFELFPQDRILDVSLPLLDALIMETPFVVLCSNDCAGLCPHCGINLNKESCSCELDRRAESRDNPFAALKDLHFEKES